MFYTQRGCWKIAALINLHQVYILYISSITMKIEDKAITFGKELESKSILAGCGIEVWGIWEREKKEFGMKL